MEDLTDKGKSWPMLLDFSKEECQQILRAQELGAYSSIVSVFRAQGELTKEKKKLLHDIQTTLSIPLERHRAEIRRALNDEGLNTIAHLTAGPNTSVEWTVEGRRLVPLLPRAAPLVAYSALATYMAQKHCSMNYNLPKPCTTAVKEKRHSLELDSEGTDSEDETEGLRYLPKSMIPDSLIHDEGPYNILPLSEARCAAENLKSKRIKLELQSTVADNLNASSDQDTTASLAPTTVTAVKVAETLLSTPRPIGTSTPLRNVSTSIPVSTSRRKRKRSVTSDPTISNRSQPVVTLSQNPTPASSPQVPVSSKINCSQSKAEATSNLSCKITAQKVLPASTIIPQSQKVILVSNSSTNSSPEISYIRSNSISLKGDSPSFGKEAISLSSDKPTGNTVGTASVNLIGPPTTVQMKSGIPTTNKPTVQLRQDAISGRVINRNAAVPNSSQNLYVVTTNSGMITVVARTLSSQNTSVGGHRVVSVNSVVSRPSISSIKSSGTTSTLSMAVTPKVMQTKAPFPNQASPMRPTANPTKNSVIVLQRNAISNSSVRAAGIQGYKDISCQNVQRGTPSVVQSCVSKAGTNGPCVTQNTVPSMVVIKPPAPKIMSAFTTTGTITEVPARTMASSLIYVEPNFGGKKTSTIRTTLTLTSTTDGPSIMSSRMADDDLNCRVTGSCRNFSPITTIVPSSAKRQTNTKESEVKRKKDIKENNIPLLQINKCDKSLKKVAEPCVTKITKLSTSLANLYAPTISKKPAILSNNFAFAKSAKKSIKDDQNDSRDADGCNSVFEKSEKKSDFKNGLDPKSEFGEDEMAILVERAVEVLRSGDKEQARTLLHKAGLELHESPQGDQVDGESFTISSMNTEQNTGESGVTTSNKTDVICKDSVVTKNTTNSPLPQRKIATDDAFSNSEAEKPPVITKITEDSPSTEKQKIEINLC